MLSAFGKIERDIVGATVPAASRAFPIVRPAAFGAPAPEAMSRANFGVLPSVILHGAALVFLLMEMTGGQPVEAPQVTLVSLVAAVADTTAGEAATAAPATEPLKPMPPPAYQPPAPSSVLAAAEAVVMPILEPDAVALEKKKSKAAPEKSKNEKPKEKKKPAAKAAPAKTKPAVQPRPTAVPPVTAPAGTTKSQAAAAQTAIPAPATTTIASAVNSGATTAPTDTPLDAPVMITDPGYAGACPIDYPARAQRRNQQGTVVIRALIGVDGRPSEVLVKSSSGFRLLDEAARDAIADCAFKPQLIGGKPVKAIVEIPIPFKLI